MNINITKLYELLDDNLTLQQRGILVTILAVKEIDSKLTLAKFKAKVKIGQIREDLITLHKAEYIDWSEYKAAIRVESNKVINPEIIELIQYINTLLKTKYKENDKTIVSMLNARLSDYSPDDIKAVFANRYAVWKDDSFMSKYLAPDTILRPSKFPKYLEEVNKTKEGLFYVNVKEIDLKKGDTITYEISKTLINDDVYQIKIYTTKGFKRVTNGIVVKKFGKDIKKILNNMKQTRNAGRLVNAEIVYNGN